MTALMMHQNVADGDALAKLLDQIPREEQIDVIGNDGAYDTKPCHSVIAARNAVPSIPPHEGAAHWLADTPCAAWRNGTVDAIARDAVGENRRKTVATTGDRLPRMRCIGPRRSPENCLWARHIDSQATAKSPLPSASLINRMADLARPQSVRIA
ncbi:MAG: IS5 family transposase ISBam3 [Burkholderia gladioli]|nr:MAG: IS5 family transposase ISBam3 [Burkholderia gladioli]